MASIGKLQKGLKGGGFESALRGIATPQDADLFNFNATEEAINDYLYKVIARLQESLKKNDSVVRGVLSQSLEPILVSTTNGKVHMAIQYEDYGVGLDEGTKPEGYTKENMAKTYPDILQWVKNKKSLQDISSNQKKKMSFAFLVSRKILRKGTTGNHWLSDVIGDNGDKLSNELSQVLSAVFAKDIEVSVTKQSQKMLNGNNRK